MSLAREVRRADPDRYFCALFAPAACRETLFTLYAFNHELARACEVAREPGLALIRLHWWREIVEGEAKSHPVATPLHQALSAGQLHQGILLDMLAARDREAESNFETLSDWLAWLKQGAGSVMVAAARALGAPSSELFRIRELGAAYGLAGQLRNMAVLAAQGRCLLPAEVMARFGAAAPDALRAEGRMLLGDGIACQRAWAAAVLPAIFAYRDLRRSVLRPRGMADRLVVMGAMASKRAVFS